MPRPPQKLLDRVDRAATTVLQRNGTVGPLELLAELGFLATVHLVEWQKGNSHYNPLQPHIQCGEEKLQQTYQLFLEWVGAQKLEPIESTYSKASRAGAQPLQITISGDPEAESFFSTHFRPSNLTPARMKQLEKKLNKAPDLVVFQMTSASSQCGECAGEMSQGDLLFKEGENGLCLACADMDHLEFLPSGNVAMTRRSKKHSPLSAVVVRFNARRKRYERQGLLVTSAAIDAAEEQCAADADQRAVRRARAVDGRVKADAQLIEEMTAKILELFPACPLNEAQEIASHTAVRGSGRVGRSAAGRELQSDAIELAVGAHVRHVRTNYDELLMQGVERQQARFEIASAQADFLAKWRGLLQ